MTDSTYEYRAFIVSISKLLKAEEIYEIATIWLGGKTDISIYEPGDDKKALGLKLFITMDCLAIFSWTDLSDLLKILKSVNRFDLVKMVESFMKKKGNSSTKKHTKKNRDQEEERKQLHQIYENLVKRSLELERSIIGLRTLLRKEDLDHDEAVSLVRGAESVTQNLAVDTDRDLNNLVRRSRADSGTSSSSEESSRRNSRVLEPVPEPVYEFLPDDIVTNFQSQPLHQLPNKDKPIPKPRPTRRQPCYPTSEESKENKSALALAPRARLPDLPTTRRTHPRSAATNFDALTEEEEDDRTGDSGMGTGSGSAQYGGVEEWRHAMKNPPPVPEKPQHRSRPRATTESEDAALYTPIREGTKDRAHSYQELKRGSPLF